MKLWKYNPVTGYWIIAREVQSNTAKQWLAVFQKDEPHAHFKLSKNRPNTKPIKKNPRKRKSAPSKKNLSTRSINPREIATRYKFCVEFSDDQKKWNEYGTFTAREIAEDIAHHLAKKYPTVYIRVSDKTRKV